ncbi:hypothetical protein MHBO_005074 [Bonamia ostreae]|uniref:DEAD/DEAH-box helicase domain-containing protein n=1 Tax=Bonamia ostreae TaxID=126728 RepID=A0ABV2AW09_9EUKA
MNENLYCDLLDFDKLKKAVLENSENSETFEKSELSINDSNKIDFDTNIDNIDIDDSINKALKDKFGLKQFRPGQKEIIKLVMSEESCLSILPTGTGKSLCFQLPSYLLKGVTIVVTPLISLMQDHLRNLPNCLNGKIWNSVQKQV